MSILKAASKIKSDQHQQRSGGESLFALAKRGDAAKMEIMINAHGEDPMTVDEINEQTKVHSISVCL
jgi:hypothetical protein